MKKLPASLLLLILLLPLPARAAAVPAPVGTGGAVAAAGEARRRQGDLAGAEESLRAAAGCLAHGTGDLLVEARLLEFEAALRRQQGRGREAASLLKLAAARYRESGEADLLKRALAARDELLRDRIS
ncbi:MAG TPA: hypothetical protein VIJ26_12985 [Thermoanaerobaculia bacterium]